MVHSGGAYGGHYYAFIKSFEDNKWYSFNDYQISELDPKDISDRVNGGLSNETAYVLFYKEIDVEASEH